MGFRMPLLDEVHDSVIKAVATDQIIAEVLNLDERAAFESAQREIERSAAPVKDEHHLVAQEGKLPTEIRLGAEVTVESGKRLVYKLVHVNACGTGRFPQLLAPLAGEMDGDGQHCPIEFVTGQAT